MENDSDFLTITDVVILTGESSGTIRRRVDRGVIKAIKTSLGLLFDAKEIEKYIRVRGELPTDGRAYYNIDLLKERMNSDADSKDTDSSD